VKRSQVRYFRLTAGATADDAIDWVERCGHAVVRTVLTPASSVALYGICEIAPPADVRDVTEAGR
jgi:hypothetical protein